MHSHTSPLTLNTIMIRIFISNLTIKQSLSTRKLLLKIWAGKKDRTMMSNFENYSMNVYSAQNYWFIVDFLVGIKCLQCCANTILLDKAAYLYLLHSCVHIFSHKSFLPAFKVFWSCDKQIRDFCASRFCICRTKPDWSLPT